MPKQYDKAVLFENLNDGLDNLPELITWSDEDIAIDLICFCEDFEDFDADDDLDGLIAGVKEWKQSKSTDP